MQEGTDLSPGATVLVFMRVIVRVRVVMGIVFVRGFDKEAGTGEPPTQGSFGFEENFFRKVQSSDGLLEEREGKTEIQKGGGEHVSANSGGTIEMKMGGGHTIG